MSLDSVFEYQIGGSLPVDAPTYVRRQADSDLYDGLKSREFCYVLNSRQMGKSSLRVQTMQRLQAEGIACAEIDMTVIGSHEVTPQQWYAGVVHALVSSFHLFDKLNLEAWWREREFLSPVQRLSEFIEGVLLQEVHQDIVIFVDEIDSVLSLKFEIDEFFALIQTCYNKRASRSDYKRLTFALLGVASPSDLIRDTNHTPFNIGRAIQLNGFRLEEAQPLAAGLVEKADNPQLVLEAVLAWTGGQPFLTQKLCKLITNLSTIPPYKEAEWVEQLVRSQIVENWETTDEPEHLKTIRDRLLRSGQRTTRLLRLYQQILQQGEVAVDDSSEQNELRLSGLVVKQQSSLKVYNRIYAAVFNRAWVDKALLDLRPYGLALEAWVASNYQDESKLLRAQALRDAQAWAAGKSLSDRDYQFLSASLELETRELQIALQAERARQTLGEGRKAAQPQKKRILSERRFQSVLLLSIAVTTAIMGVRQLGLLQAVELHAFDSLQRLRPDEGPDPRLLLVTITEKDVQNQNPQERRGASLSDRTLTQLLNKLQRYQPQVIGWDTYHDFPVDPNYTDLKNHIKHNERLIGVCEVGGGSEHPGTRQPPEIPSNRIGFSNFPVDSDDIIRRQLLGMSTVNNSFCQTDTSFSFRVAQSYLAAKGIQYKRTRLGDLQIGNVVFKKLKSDSGGYNQIYVLGYQVMLNYRSSKKVADQVTLGKILSNSLDHKLPNLVRNRIVIIGTTAPSFKDYSATPYTAGHPSQKIAGVIIQAHAVSQILSAVLDGRPLLWWLPDWGVTLWVWGWSLVGGMFALYLRSLRNLVLMIGSILIVLPAFCFILLLKGGWMPLVPSVLAVAISCGSVLAYSISQSKQQKYLDSQS